MNVQILNLTFTSQYSHFTYCPKEVFENKLISYQSVNKKKERLCGTYCTVGTVVLRKADEVNSIFRNNQYMTAKNAMQRSKKHRSYNELYPG